MLTKDSGDGYKAGNPQEDRKARQPRKLARAPPSLDVQ
jgi:hypothetical protein